MAARIYTNFIQSTLVWEVMSRVDATNAEVEVASSCTNEWTITSAEGLARNAKEYIKY
jgi:hypothetical protein